jgi:hypothetical protein
MGIAEFGISELKIVRKWLGEACEPFSTVRIQPIEGEETQIGRSALGRILKH